MNLYRLLLSWMYFTIMLTLFACSNESGKEGDDRITLDDKGKEIFENFHYKFFQDSSFQLARIEFPLQVIPTNQFNLEETKSVLKTIEEWQYMRYIDFEKEKDMKQYVEAIAEDFIKETILFKGFFYRMEYNQETHSGKWFLTKYIEIQPTNRADLHANADTSNTQKSTILDTITE